MLLLFPQGTPGFVPKNVSDTFFLQDGDGPIVDIDIDTIDICSLSVVDVGTSTTVVQNNRAEFFNLRIVDVSSVERTNVTNSREVFASTQFTGLPLLFPQGTNGDPCRLTLIETASVFRDPALVDAIDTANLSITETAEVSVTLDATDTASVTVTDTGSVFSDQQLLPVTETTSLTLTETTVVVVSVTATDTTSLTLTDSGAVFATDEITLKPVTDTFNVSLGDVANAVVAVNAQDVCSLNLDDSGAFVVNNGVRFLERIDTASLMLEETAVPVIGISGTDTASLHVLDDANVFADNALSAADTFTLAATDTAQLLNIVDVADTARLQCDDFAAQNDVADVAINRADDALLHLDERAQVRRSNPPGQIKFLVGLDQIRIQAVANEGSAE